MNRSANMRAIRSKDMLPELAVRRLVHKLGYRFRLHRATLPGQPDLVFGPRRKVIFVHGCFWHSHGCKKAHVPKSNRHYWLPKLRRNRTRDSEKHQDAPHRGLAVPCHLGVREPGTGQGEEARERIPPQEIPQSQTDMKRARFIGCQRL